MRIVRSIDNAHYPRIALAKAREAYREYCSVKLVPLEVGLIEVTVEVKLAYLAESRQIILEFWNFCLDTACEMRMQAA
jgi:hypothetical protein